MRSGSAEVRVPPTLALGDSRSIPSATSPTPIGPCRKTAHWAPIDHRTWQTATARTPIEVPLVIAGEEIVDDRTVRDSLDPSRPGTVVARYRQATEADIDRAVASRKSRSRRLASPIHRRARRNPPSGRRPNSPPRAATSWARCSPKAARRSPKAIPKSPKRSTSAASTPTAPQFFHELARLSAQGRGVVVVVSPWNFPLAIPCGGVAAALAAGNTVILKPASDTVLIAYLLCQCFWRAGVPKPALQFAPCSGGTVGARLVSHDGVDAVILTGGTETAAEMLRNKPTMHLLAETGGKNATIVTALSDRDQAIKNVLHSAFSHSGQKCSATSLLILESEVYHDASFRAALCDAVESLRVGSAWDLADEDRPAHPPAIRRARNRPQGTRAGRRVGRHAATARRRQSHTSSAPASNGACSPTASRTAPNCSAPCSA